eukprot:6615046-Lingulodinium_polyedra.AAC.1
MGITEYSVAEKVDSVVFREIEVIGANVVATKDRDDVQEPLWQYSLRQRSQSFAMTSSRLQRSRSTSQ